MLTVTYYIRSKSKDSKFEKMTRYLADGHVNLAVYWPSQLPNQPTVCSDLIKTILLPLALVYISTSPSP